MFLKMFENEFISHFSEFFTAYFIKLYNIRNF